MTALPGVEVWVDEATRLTTAAFHFVSDFHVMYEKAQAAGGCLRTVRTSLDGGAKLWLVGRLRGSQFEVSMVADFDPRVWARRRLIALVGLIARGVIWAMGGTVLPLQVPRSMTPLAMASRER